MSTLEKKPRPKRRSFRKEFSKKLLSIVPHLHPYVKHRLYIAESIGILPRNMYCSNGIIDDAIIKVFGEEKLNLKIDTLSLELELFKLADQLLDEINVKEGWHRQAISTSYFLQHELNSLHENFYSDADNELMQYEELQGISNWKDTASQKIFIYNDSNTTLHKVLQSESASHDTKQRLLGKFYSWLPLETSKIIDLFIFGKLNFVEIAAIMEIPALHVKQVIIDVRKSFRRNLV